MSLSKALFAFLLFFIGGVFISSFLNVPQLIIYELFVLGIFYSLIFFREKAILVFGICLIFLTFGILRTEIAQSNLNDNSFPETSVIEDKPPTFLKKWEGKIFPLKQELREIVYQNFSPPYSSILAALILGDKREIPENWKEKLNIAGVRHITAVSGLHVVIVSGILLWLGIGIGLHRGQAFYFALFFLWFFILMIGFQPSAVRAGIMGSMLLFCQKIGRQRMADRALLITAVLMLAINPLLLRSNLGFQLSFLATLGIIYLMPFLQNLFERIKLARLGEVSNLLAMTFSAQIFVLPILIYNFGQFSLVSPITNVLILPLLPYIMIAGFIFLIGGLLWQALGWILAFPLWFLLSYLTGIVDLFSRFSFSSIVFQISWIWLPISYSIMGYSVWYIKKKKKLNLFLAK